MRFSWDPAKARSNLRKHGVSFDEAATLFKDPLAFIFDDFEHSELEPREIIIGLSVTRKLLLISFVERQGNVVRLLNQRPTCYSRRDKRL